MKIEINYFPVEFPNGKLPFWIRKLKPDEKLRPEERLFRLAGKPTVQGESVAVLCEGEKPSAEYSCAEYDPVAVKPFVVSMILESSLRVAMHELGYIVDRGKTGTRFFDPKRQFHSVPDYVTVLRGLEFRADTLRQKNELAHGFFVSTTSRVMFSKNIEDLTIAKLALNRSVVAEADGSTFHGVLTAFDSQKKLATVSSLKHTKQYPAAKVFLQGNAANIMAYCRTTRRTGEARKAILAGQFANYRVIPSGMKNPNWLRNQYEAVSTWLDAISGSGAISVKWLFSPYVFTIKTRPVCASLEAA